MKLGLKQSPFSTIKPYIISFTFPGEAKQHDDFPPDLSKAFTMLQMNSNSPTTKIRLNDSLLSSGNTKISYADSFFVIKQIDYLTISIFAPRRRVPVRLQKSGMI